jgi:hypothetical protein
MYAGAEGHIPLPCAFCALAKDQMPEAAEVVGVLAGPMIPPFPAIS